MSDDIFGPVVLDTEIGTQVEQTLQLWMPSYLAFVSRALATNGVDLGGPLIAPGAWVHTSDPTHFPEEAPPAIVIAVPGTLGKPQTDQNYYRAFWDVQVIAYVTATSRESTENLAKYYATVIRNILINKPSLGNFAEGTSWLGSDYGLRGAPKDDRTLGSCTVRFSVDVRDVVQRFVGPPEPITTVPADWPTVTQASVIPAPLPLS